jgi:hypothetical protein
MRSPLGLLLAAVFAIAAEGAAAAKLAVPSYFYPDCDWNASCLWRQLEDGAPAVGLAVINPGVYTLPDPRIDPRARAVFDDDRYRRQVQSARARGIVVLGYVPTHWAARDLFLVKDDIEVLYRLAPLDGIFVDEVPNRDCRALAYFAEIGDHVRGHGGLGVVALNPGATTQECYMSEADVVVNFEGSYDSYLRWAPAGWERLYPATRFWHLVHDTRTEAAMHDAVRLSEARGAGWIYVTPDHLPNPWDALPTGSYWSSLLSRTTPR